MAAFIAFSGFVAGTADGVESGVAVVSVADAAWHSRLAVCSFGSSLTERSSCHCCQNQDAATVVATATQESTRVDLRIRHSRALDLP